MFPQDPNFPSCILCQFLLSGSRPKETEPEVVAPPNQNVPLRRQPAGFERKPIKPAEAVEDGIEPLPPPADEQADEPPLGQEIPNLLPEWSNFDLGTALKALRSEDAELQPVLFASCTFGSFIALQHK